MLPKEPAEILGDTREYIVASDQNNNLSRPGLSDSRKPLQRVICEVASNTKIDKAYGRVLGTGPQVRNPIITSLGGGHA